ncbi:hypothetical protein C8Q78DRAFT_994512 [Trametes maxima]|nr:hypothetical protein C8Q78DRAFT_994512 [Trametes maxima]
MLRALVQSLRARALNNALFPLLCLKNQYFAFYYLSTFFNSFASSNLVENWLNGEQITLEAATWCSNPVGAALLWLLFPHLSLPHASSFDLEENWWSCGGFSRDRGGGAGDVAAISRSFWACLLRIVKTYKGISSPQNNLRLRGTRQERIPYTILGSSTIVAGVMDAYLPVFLQTTRNSRFPITGITTVVLWMDAASEHLSNEVLNLSFG